jgi:structural maintenance of chromosome 2
MISYLDIKKSESLTRVVAEVDQHFSRIFKSLLDNVDARLVTPGGKTLAEGGLEFRVSFSGKWKDSLSELSGGQKSLLALSLVLALALVRSRDKPTPLYILDEVDAAMDVRHTSNMGKLFKQHFPKSQFVVVSLKEGMFENANVSA